MILSMTGFGRGEAPFGDGRVIVEIGTVNSRHLETNVRGLRDYPAVELGLRGRITGRLGRGTANVTVTLKGAETAVRRVSANLELARAYEAEFDKLVAALGLKGKLPLETLAAVPDLIAVESEDADAETLAAAVYDAADHALEDVVAMRQAEGAKLAAEIGPRLDELARLDDEIENLAPATIGAYRERLKARIAELDVTAGVDAGRVEAEVALFADRCDVREEIVRSRAHIEAFRDTVAAGGRVGRQLDFLVQEMNREANTIGSKAQDAAIAARVVAIKNLLEQVREQVQNVE